MVFTHGMNRMVGLWRRVKDHTYALLNLWTLPSSKDNTKPMKPPPKVTMSDLSVSPCIEQQAIVSHLVLCQGSWSAILSLHA